jgi:hypothetical protein
MAATSFRTESGVAVNGTHARSSVVAARVVFSREIRGVPVVGAGSKVTVTFLNDGAVESFRYDWPIYEQTSRTQQIVSSSEIVRRIQRVAAVGTDGYVGDKVTQNPRGGKIDHPVALNRQSQLQDLKCGYYDPGLLNRDAKAPIYLAPSRPITMAEPTVIDDLKSSRDPSLSAPVEVLPTQRLPLLKPILREIH